MKSKVQASIDLLPPQIPKVLVTPDLPDGLSAGGTYTGALIQQLILSGQEIDDLTLEQCVLKHARLGQTHMRAPRLVDVRLDTCDLAEAEWQRAHITRLEISGCRLMGWRLSESGINDVLVKGCNAQFAQFSQSVLKAIRFENCNLSHTDFGSTELTNIVFKNCDLSNSRFAGARMSSVDFRGSKVEGMQVEVKDLRGAILDQFQALSLVRLLGITVEDEGSLSVQ